MKVNPFKDQLALYLLSIGVFEVDEEGRIWRVKVRRGKKLWRWVAIQPKRAEYVNDKGYLRILPYFNGRQYNIYAHRVSYMFHKGLIPEGMEPNHKNGIKYDNRPENLELVTPRENQMHSYEVLGRKNLRGEKHWKAKLSEKKVLKIRRIRKIKKTPYAALAKMYRVSIPTISEIITRRTWAHI